MAILTVSEETRRPKTVTFTSLPLRTVFKFGSKVWLKVNNDIANKGRAVDLADGCLGAFCDTDRVTPAADATISVKWDN